MPRRLRFGPYLLEPEKLALERDGLPVALRPKLVETLIALIEAAPGVASKEQLMERVWPDVHVVESSLTRNISELRSELEAGMPGETVIETVPKRGYRFVPPVIEESAAPAAQPERSPRVLPRLALAVAASILVVVVGLAAGRLSGPDAEAVGEAPDSALTVSEAAFRSGFTLIQSWNAADVQAALYQFERSTRATPELWYGYHGSLTAQLTSLLLSGDDSAPAIARLRETADSAVLYGPEIAVTHAGRGTVLLLASWDWAGALREIEEGIRWNPENPMPHQRRGLWKTLRGRFDEARLDYGRALELQPGWDECVLANAYNELCAGRPVDAIAALEAILKTTPKQETAHRLLAAAYGMKGDWAEAEAALAKAWMPAVDRLNATVWRMASTGDVEGARTARERLQHSCADADLPYCDTALADTALGDFDAAFASLEAGLRRRQWKLLALAIDPRLEPLHSDPRWTAIVEAVRGAETHQPSTH